MKLCDKEYIENLKKEGTRDDLINELDKFRILVSNINLLNSSLTLDEVLKVVLSEACGLLNSRTASIFLHDKKANRLDFAATTDASITDLKSLSIPIDKGIAGHVFKTGEVINIRNIQNDDRYYKNIDEILCRKTEAYLCVPLIVRDTIIGTAQIMDRNGGGCYTERDADLMLIFGEQSAAAIERARLYDERLNKEILEKENMRMKTELDLARDVQTMLLPRKEELLKNKDLNISMRMDTASEVGGDFMEALPRDDGTVYFAIGDVIDHGLLSGIITLMVQSSYRTLIENPALTLTEMLVHINTVLFGNLQERMKNNFNLTLMLLKYRNGCIECAGQHESVLIYRKSAGDVEVIDTGNMGMYVGLIPRIEQFLSPKTIELSEGDVLLLFTDGATEAENDNGEEYGRKRLIRSLARHGKNNFDGLLGSLYDDIIRWMGAAPFYDDITMMAVQKK